MSIIKKIEAIKFEKKFGFFMFFVGLVMMFLIPTWQVPDEYTHLAMIGSAIKNEEFAENIMQNTSIQRTELENQPDAKVDWDAFVKGLTESPDYSRADMRVNGIHYSAVRQLPSLIGIRVGILLELPVYWTLQLGELCSLIFSVIICCLALTLMPIKKELYAMSMLIPMVLQEAGGITYDAVLIPLCFLWIALIMHMKFEKEKITWKDIMLLFLLWLIITYIKLPYCLIVFLIFMLPLDKIHIRLGRFEINKDWIKKYGIIVCILGAVVMMAGIYLIRDNQWIQLLWGMTKEWKRTLYLLKETGVEFHEMLIISTVGNFGWLDTPISYAAAIFFFVVLFIVAFTKSKQPETIAFHAWDRIVMLGTVIAICVLVTLAMVNHTILVMLYGWEFIQQEYDIQSALYQIPYIGGIQGRYYLPFVSLFFLPLPQILRVDNKILRVVIAVFEAVLYTYIIGVLLNRYWI